jgi:hypothetical protein
MDQQEFRKLVRKIIIQKSKTLNERFDDEDDDLGIYSADFDPNEFGGDAMRAAMQDIGDEFEPLGKNKFEKNINPEEFIADLQRQNLNLPKDKEELSDIDRMMNKKKSHEKKFGAGSLNEDGNEIQRDVFDTTNLYKFLKDIFYTFLEGNGSDLNYDEAAKFTEEELIKHFNVTKKSQMSFGLNEGHVNTDSKIDRPKDTEGQPLTIRTRVEDLETGSAGRVIRFGVDDNGKLTVHVEWTQDFGGQVPSTITYPDKIVARDNNRIVREEKTEDGAYPSSRYMFFGNLQQIQRQAGLMLKMNEEQVNGILEGGHDWAQDHIATAKESMDQVFDFLMNETNSDNKEEEIDESMIRSHANGRGQNLKPNNFPEEFERFDLNENLDQAIDVDGEVFLVIDNDFNRAHYKDLIGKTFNDAPGYAQVKLVKRNTPEIPQDSIEADFHRAVEVSEDFDFAAAEREHAGQEELDTLESEAMQVVPENLIKFLDPNSFTSDANGYSFILKIPKQENELLKDIELFVREEIGTDKQINLYTVLEKATNKWIIDVKFINTI